MEISAFTDILSRPFEEALDMLAGIGLKTVDLRSKIGEDTVDTLNGDAAKKVRNSVLERGLKVGCVASWGVNCLWEEYDPADPQYRMLMRERTRHLAELAVTLETKHVRVYSFKRNSDVTESDRADNAAFLTELADICGDHGVILLVENEPPSVTATCAELGDLMGRDVPGSLKINWDIVNGWRAGEVPWNEGVFANIAGHVAQVHVKGARGNSHGEFASMALPGRDDVPHREIFQVLHKSGFDGIVTIDPHYDQFEQSDKLSDVENPVLEVVRLTKLYLEQIIGELN